MIKLTAPDGQPVEISPAAISEMYPNDGTYHHDAKTVLIVGGGHQAVKETIEQIDALMRGAA